MCYFPRRTLDTQNILILGMIISLENPVYWCVSPRIWPGAGGLYPGWGIYQMYLFFINFHYINPYVYYSFICQSMLYLSILTLFHWEVWQRRVGGGDNIKIPKLKLQQICALNCNLLWFIPLLTFWRLPFFWNLRHRQPRWWFHANRPARRNTVGLATYSAPTFRETAISVFGASLIFWAWTIRTAPAFLVATIQGGTERRKRLIHKKMHY